MKILIVTDLYPISSVCRDATITNAIEDFALGLKQFGNEVCVIRPNFLLNAFIRKHKILKNGIYNSKDVKIYNKNFILPFLNSDISYLKKESFDIIISHMPSGHIYASLINKKLNLPHIAIAHQSDYTVLNSFKYKFYFKNRLKKALNSATLIGARNEFLKQKVSADFVLPSYVETSSIVDNKVFSKDKIKFITLSKLIKRKNIDLVIKALSCVDFDFQYDIFGEGEMRKKLEKLIDKYKLQDKIEIHSPIRHHTVYSKLDEYDVFIMPSINESFGLSYIEALAAGLVVVGTKNTGIDGIIKDNKNGFLVEPKFNKILKTLYKIRDCNKSEISHNALESARLLCRENVIKDYMEIINKVVELYI